MALLHVRVQILDGAAVVPGFLVLLSGPLPSWSLLPCLALRRNMDTNPTPHWAQSSTLPLV
jgi:hypothetical protein